MAEQLYFSRDARLFVEFAGGFWEVPILDGYSFSQATNSSEITLSEMENASGRSRRGRRMFNDSLAAAEWSFSTYARPFKSAGGGADNDADSASEHHSVEEVFWAMMAGADTYASSAFTRTTNPVSGPVVTPGTSTETIVFTESNRSVLSTANFYFVISTSAATPLVYKINQAVVNEVTMDFDVDGIAMCNWSGFAKTVEDFSGSVHYDATLPIFTDVTVDGTTIAVGDLWIDSDNDRTAALMTNVGDGTEAAQQAIDEAINSTNTFIRNRLTQLSITASDAVTFPGGGAGVYTMTLTGGSFTISNNISYLVPEEIGTVNIPIEHVTGSRTVSGSFTCYISYDDSSNGGTSSDFFKALTASEALEDTVNDFDLTMKIGGDGTDTTLPYVSVHLGQAHVEIPNHSIEDVISLETSFHGLPSDLSSSDEVDVTYYGPTPDVDN